MGKIDKKNAEGYADPTYYGAFRNIEVQEMVEKRKAKKHEREHRTRRDKKQA